MESQEKLTKAERKILKKEERIHTERMQEENSRRNKWIMIGLVVLVVVGVYGWWQATKIDIPESELKKPVNEILPIDWQLGNAQGKVKVIEYSDFQCPACKTFEGVAQKLTSLSGGQVGFAYRSFPLRQIHKYSQLAAQAAEAAGKQGKFWEMSEKLFANQEKWSDSDKAQEFFVTYAKELGLNEAKFVGDLNSKEIKALVEADYISGQINKLDSTPTFFVNGQKMNNLKGQDDLIARVELTLQEATQSGTTQ